MPTATIEPFSKDQMTLSQAARLLPMLRRNRPVSPSMLWRWYRYGVKAQDGTLVKLRVWRVGGQTFTSEAALREFFSQLSATDTDSTAKAAPDVDRARNDAVEAQLDSLGIGGPVATARNREPQQQQEVKS